MNHHHPRGFRRNPSKAEVAKARAKLEAELGKSAEIHYWAGRFGIGGQAAAGEVVRSGAARFETRPGNTWDPFPDPATGCHRKIPTTETYIVKVERAAEVA